jgi:hypothetical protein
MLACPRMSAQMCFSRILEAYPLDKPERSHNDFIFGSRSLYERARFTEVARRSPTRVVMRLALW